MLNVIDLTQRKIKILCLGPTSKTELGYKNTRIYRDFVHSLR